MQSDHPICHQRRIVKTRSRTSRYRQFRVVSQSRRSRFVCHRTKCLIFDVRQKKMSFADPTGKTKEDICQACGSRVIFEEFECHGRMGHTFDWQPVEHLAPCGAHCAGGGYDQGEEDVHIPAFGKCPRCGATDSRVATIIERSDGEERIVIHEYLTAQKRDIGFRIDLEQRIADGWKIKSRWNTGTPHSLNDTVTWAGRYVPWHTPKNA